MGVELLAPDAPTGNQFQPMVRVGTRELAARLHTPHRTVIRWRAEGIPRHGIARRVDGSRRWVDLPDHLACTYAGTHPALIWPDWLEDPDPELAEDSAA